MFNSQQLYDFIDEQWQTQVMPSLCDYIKIPNKSPNFDSKWQEHGYMNQAVSHIAQWCQSHAPKNMTLDILQLPNRTPLIFMEIPGQIKQNVLFYGHLDKQPEMEGWEEGLHPWTPTLRDGKLYGRGGADDGYAAYATLTALCALEAQGLDLPHCFIIIEACEESGSYDLPAYIDLLKPMLGDPNLVVCLDSGAGNYEQFWMTTSLRGNIVGELSVEVLTEGVHSGNASGIVADSFRVARQLISTIEDEATGEIKLSTLHCPIPTERINQANYCAQVLGEQVYKAFPWVEGALPVSNDYTQLILNRTWRPALTVTGADGLPAIADAGNVLRSKTALKLSMRIPPLVDPQQASLDMKAALIKSPPYNAKVDFITEGGSPGWNAPVISMALAQAADDASHFFFGKPAAYMGEGGTIPFMGMLGEQFPNTQFIITGVLGPHSNAHGPNEFLHLDYVKKLTCCIAYILHHYIKDNMA